jgi:hypothetical protein
MLLEDLLLAIAIGIVVLLVGWPILRFLRTASPLRKDPLAEAHERLRLAKREAEAARINREADRIYEALYEDTLKDDGASARTRVAAEEERPEEPGEEERRPVEPPPEKGKRHGHG